MKVGSGQHLQCRDKQNYVVKNRKFNTNHWIWYHQSPQQDCAWIVHEKVQYISIYISLHNYLMRKRGKFNIWLHSRPILKKCLLLNSQSITVTQHWILPLFNNSISTGKIPSKIKVNWVNSIAVQDW